MRVKELIAELQKQNPEAEVLTSNNDDWCYDTDVVTTAYIKNGKRILEPVDGDILYVLIY